MFTSNKQTARIAGLLYLAVVVTGIFSLAYVPSKLIVWDNAATTVGNIKNSILLFRWGIVSSLLCYIFFLLLPLYLYKLLKHVNKTYAVLMVGLAAVSVPVSLVNLLNKFAVLSLLGDNNFNLSLTTEQLQSQVMFYLNQYDNGILVLQIFWGLWLFPLGLLVFKSDILPKLLGILLMAGCIGYLLNFIGNMLVPGYGEAGISRYVRLPATLGEIGTCLWLLITGTRESKTKQLVV
jgi:hypothetical protein